MASEHQLDVPYLNEDIKDFQRYLLPGGTPMCLHVSMAFIIKERDKIAEELGISSKAKKISTTFDIIKALACRLEYISRTKDY